MRAVLAICLVFLLLGVACAKDYTVLDKNGQYRGFVRDLDRRIDTYDRSGRPDGWVDKDSGYTFDRNNNVRGSFYGTDDNDD
jgi:hypothetical protein